MSFIVIFRTPLVDLWSENDGQKLRGLENAELENDGQIFDDVCLSAADAVHHLSFHSVESSMYKRRRLSQQPLPIGAKNTDDALRNSRYMQLQGKAFYRGLADPDDATSALLFASDEQLELLMENSRVLRRYFQSSAKAVLSAFYRFRTIC